MKNLFSLLSQEQPDLYNSEDASKAHSFDLYLGGGGQLGAYQAGVLQALLENPQIKFDRVLGTSAGSFNAHLANQTDRAQATKSLISAWKSIGRVGDMAQQYEYYNPVGFHLTKTWHKAAISTPTPLKHYKAAVKSFGNYTGGALQVMGHFLNGWIEHLENLHHKAAHQLGPAELIQDIIKRALPLNTEEAYDCQVHTVTKMNEDEDLTRDNIESHILKATPDTVIASGALKILGGKRLEDGKTHWDGAYDPEYPPLHLFEGSRQKPLIVVSLDDKNIRKSKHDPLLTYGMTHEKVSQKQENGETVYHITLADRMPHIPDEMRMNPDSNMIKDLIKLGYEDGLACLKKMEQDRIITPIQQGDYEYDAQDCRAA